MDAQKSERYKQFKLKLQKTKISVCNKKREKHFRHFDPKWTKCVDIVYQCNSWHKLHGEQEKKKERNRERKEVSLLIAVLIIQLIVERDKLPSRNCFDSSGGEMANDSILTSLISWISFSTSAFRWLNWSSTSLT